MSIVGRASPERDVELGASEALLRGILWHNLQKLALTLPRLPLSSHSHIPDILSLLTNITHLQLETKGVREGPMSPFLLPKLVGLIMDMLNYDSAVFDSVAPRREALVVCDGGFGAHRSALIPATLATFITQSQSRIQYLQIDLLSGTGDPPKHFAAQVLPCLPDL
ncbi:hypothetical protein BDV98DRAFT_124110 [Pterulicium gracile]|uniref:Uncharacterized protein n=1 Tax=Pterulicium gracile TaxID=1884261 RepID=A0A5C3QDT5_9AGAR|nr:hypothetical protein BDV98DRAFT_124110 [Pterula gracilis]